MAEPWQCPACKTWLAPHVSEHRCDPEGGVGTKPVSPVPSSPSTAVYTWPTGGGVITTGPTGWTATNLTVHYSGPMTERQRLIYQRRNPSGLTLRVA